MNILSLTYEYPPVGGGGAVVAAALNEHLVAAGHSVRVLTNGMRALPAVEHIRGVEIARSACLRRHCHYTTALELATGLLPSYRLGARLLREQQPDVIHTHFILPSGIVARALSRKFRIPYVLTAHGSDIPEYNPDRFQLLHPLLKPIWRNVVKDAAAVTCASGFLTGLLHRAVDLPVHVIPNGYSPSRAVEQRKRKLVLVVARLFPRKGVQHFIEAIRGLPSDWEYVIAGDGPYRVTLQRQAAALGAPVRFVGFVDQQSLRTLYEQARILVFPSIRENFPMVLMEGLDAGCAIITTDAEGCAEVIGGAGIVVRKGTAGELREAIELLMQEPQLCEELAERAVERAAELRWPKIAAQYASVFELAARQVRPGTSQPITAAPAGAPPIRPPVRGLSAYSARLDPTLRS